MIIIKIAMDPASGMWNTLKEEKQLGRNDCNARRCDRRSICDQEEQTIYTLESQRLSVCLFMRSLGLLST